MKDKLIKLLDKKISTIELEDCDSIWTSEKIDELSDYLLSYGVIVPPCELNDLVYVIPCRENGLKEIAEMRCIGFAISRDEKNVNLVDWKNKLYQPYFSKFGIYIFPTKKEAEKALKEMRKKVRNERSI